MWSKAVFLQFHVLSLFFKEGLTDSRGPPIRFTRLYPGTVHETSTKRSSTIIFCSDSVPIVWALKPGVGSSKMLRLWREEEVVDLLFCFLFGGTEEKASRR